eukprot:g12550.t1
MRRTLIVFTFAAAFRVFGFVAVAVHVKKTPGPEHSDAAPSGGSRRGALPIGSFVRRGSPLWLEIEKAWGAGNAHALETYKKKDASATLKAGDSVSELELEILSIERVRDEELAKKYRKKKQGMVDAGGGKVKRPARFYPHVMLPAPFTSEAAEKIPQLAGAGEDTLDASVGEIYAFHGAKPEVVLRRIATHGYDVGHADARGMYGAGFYLSDQAVKSAQYTGMYEKDNQGGSRRFRSPGSILLGRALLGLHPWKFDGKLALGRFKPRPEGVWSALVVNGGGEYNDHREIVLFDSDLYLPEYLIRFTDRGVDKKQARRERDMLLAEKGMTETGNDNAAAESQEQQAKVLKENPAAICSIADEMQAAAGGSENETGPSLDGVSPQTALISHGVLHSFATQAPIRFQTAHG